MFSVISDCWFERNNASLAGGGIDASVNTLSASTAHASTRTTPARRRRHLGVCRAVIEVADSAFTKNAAGEFGGSAYATATTLTFDNVSVSQSVAGLKGGGVALTGDTKRRVLEYRLQPVQRLAAWRGACGIGVTWPS